MYIYSYLESQKHKIFWSLWEKAVMNFLFGKILFLPVMTKKIGQIKEQCSPTRSKTVFFQAVATLTQVAPDDQSRNEQKKMVKAVV